MSDYHPPVDDIFFVITKLADLERVSGFKGYEHAEKETARALLDEAARFFSEVIAPVNVPGDKQGCTLDADGNVATPAEYANAYKQFVDAGWGAVAHPADYGGGEFPWLVSLAIQEMVSTSSRAFAMAPLLTNGAIDMLSHHGDEIIKETFLPKMITSEWSGTMNLTEPQAGSDVGALTTKAVRQDDGTYRITGQKIFITYGEHELSENIIHLVLARTPDAPPGTKGISCFIVPKFLVNDDGSLGERNDVKCVAIEHKLGLHGSPTCVMSYGDDGGAVGYLIGDEQQGMRYMFKMMNNARLGVGMEGLAVTERSMQQAVDFARERKQGRAVGAPAGEQSSIIEHADVRRMLMTMRAYGEAMRCLLYFHGENLDIAAKGPDPDERQAASDLAELLTPMSKAWCTGHGVDMASLAIQVHGGYGYVEETGVAQHLRDARISPIYEGTNGIQAIDLVGRKLPMDGGAVVKGLIDRMRATADELADSIIGLQLATALDDLTAAGDWVLTNGASDPNQALAGATPYLEMFATTVAGWLMARSGVAAAEMLEAGEGDAEFLAAKQVTTRFYCEQILPQVTGLLPAVIAGAEDLFALSEDAF